MTHFFERLFYSPSAMQRVLSYALSPLSALYCLISSFDKLICKNQKPPIPVISVGNIVVGGSGKTPLVAALAKRYKNSCVVLRGYKRASRGLLVVSKKGKIVEDVDRSGDEAMALAMELEDGTVIVSEDRMEGVKKAAELGCDVVFLDDGFRHCIKKFDILIDVETPNGFCLPAGPYRLPKFFKKEADLVVVEGRDFKRRVHIKNPSKKMVLLTSIANPKRLEPYIPKNTVKYSFEDHHRFSYKEIKEIYDKERPDTFLVTIKDFVKLKEFPFSYSLLKLSMDIDESIFEKIDGYIKDFYAKKTSDGPDAA